MKPEDEILKEIAELKNAKVSAFVLKGQLFESERNLAHVLLNRVEAKIEALEWVLGV